MGKIFVNNFLKLSSSLDQIVPVLVLFYMPIINMMFMLEDRTFVLDMSWTLYNDGCDITYKKDIDSYHKEVGFWLLIVESCYVA